MFNIILIGSQGSGKGTQAKMIVEKLGVSHISTGELLRAEVKRGTKKGLKINEYISKGNLIPDEIMIGILKERLSKTDCKKGFILDGYPRNLRQATLLSTILDDPSKKIDYVLVINIPRDVAVKRIEGRFSCKKCGAMYNKYFSDTKKDNICDVCASSDFSYREDDLDIGAINKRLDIYKETTTPLIEFYNKKGLIYFIDGAKDIESVGSDIRKVLGVY
ncbi:adenylate kinase [Pseudomonadota bacterium]